MAWGSTGFRSARRSAPEDAEVTPYISPLSLGSFCTVSHREGAGMEGYVTATHHIIAVSGDTPTKAGDVKKQVKVPNGVSS